MSSSFRLMSFIAVIAMLVFGSSAPAFLQEGSADEPATETQGSVLDDAAQAEEGEESADRTDSDDQETEADADDEIAADAAGDGAEAAADDAAGEADDADDGAETLEDEGVEAVEEAGADEVEAAEEEPAEDEEVAPQVWAIVVRGNRHIDAETILRAVTATKVGEPLELENIQADLRSIYELGFFDDVRADAFEVADGLRIVLQVIENPFVHEVRVESDDVDPEVLRQWIQTRGGQVLNTVQLDEDLERVQTRALEDLDLYLRPTRADLDQDGVLWLGFRATRVKEVIIRGNQKTRDQVIRREIVVTPGEPLRRDDITRSLDRLQRLAFFQDVRVRGVDTDDPDYVSVEFEVDERMTGTAMIGAGYSSEDGLLGYAEVVERNFLGRGQSVNVRAEFGQRRTVYDVGFFEPYLFGSTTSFGINVYDRSLDRVYNDPVNDFTERRTGGDISFGRPITEFTRLSMRYRLENLQIEPLGDKSEVDESKGGTRSITLAATTDTTDHWLSPLRGARTRLSTEFGGGWLGGDYDFTKYEAEHSRYFQVGSKRQAVAVRAIGGWGIGDIEGAKEEFRVGGADTLRGYNFGDMEGDRMMVFNVEYRFPMSDSVQGVLFVDAGEAWRSEDGQKGLKTGYGIGARMDTPLGVLRLDYGIGDSGRLHFFFGPSF